MVEEAALKQTDAGLVPDGPGWFVMNARDARWIRRPGRGHNAPLTGWTEHEAESWFRRSLAHHDPLAVERFWARQGWTREQIDTRWAFDSRATFESVVQIEFPPTVADGILAEHDGTGVDYAVNLWWRTFD